MIAPSPNIEEPIMLSLADQERRHARKLREVKRKIREARRQALMRRASANPSSGQPCYTARARRRWRRKASPQLFDGAVTVLDENLRQSRLSKFFEFFKCFRKVGRQIQGLYAARIDRDDTKSSIAAFGHDDLLRTEAAFTSALASQPAISRDFIGWTRSTARWWASQANVRMSKPDEPEAIRASVAMVLHLGHGGL
jgi:hypothetical protein